MSGKSGERRANPGLDGLSRIYFSSRDGPKSAPESPAHLPATITVRNAAGAAGEAVCSALSESLRENRWNPGTVYVEKGQLFRDGETQTSIDTPLLRNGTAGNPLFVRFRDDYGSSAALVAGLGDVSILLTDGRIDSLRDCYLWIKEAIQAGSTGLATIVPAGDEQDRWLPIAPLRLAEAVVRFLGRRVAIRSSGTDLAAHLDTTSRRVRERRATRSAALDKILSALEAVGD